jgi:hypothetical protein
MKESQKMGEKEVLALLMGGKRGFTGALALS